MNPKIVSILEEMKKLQDEYISAVAGKELEPKEFAYQVRAVACIEMAYNILYSIEYKPKKTEKK